MFAGLWLFMAHDPDSLQKDPPRKHLYVVGQIEQIVEVDGSALLLASFYRHIAFVG